MENLRTALQLFLKHKGKFVLMLASAVVFLFLLFPLSDLSDLITAQVARLTNNSVYLQFEEMHLSVFPTPGIAFNEVHVEGQGIPPLKSQELIMTPSVMSLVTQKPAGTVTAKGFLQGQIEVSIKPGSKSDNGVERQSIKLNAQQLSLSGLRELAQLPVLIRGTMGVESQALADLSFQEQPDMDITLTVERFEMPGSNLQTLMGPVTLPELKLSSVELKGRLSAGKFLIETGRIGRETDEIRGTVKGNIDLTIQNRNGNLTPQFGGYNLDLDLNMKKIFQSRAELILSLMDSYLGKDVDKYRTPTTDGVHYRFKVASPNLQLPPSISALR